MPASEKEITKLLKGEVCNLCSTSITKCSRKSDRFRTGFLLKQTNVHLSIEMDNTWYLV